MERELKNDLRINEGLFINYEMFEEGGGGGVVSLELQILHYFRRNPFKNITRGENFLGLHNLCTAPKAVILKLCAARDFQECRKILNGLIPSITLFLDSITLKLIEYRGYLLILSNSKVEEKFQNPNNRCIL